MASRTLPALLVLAAALADASGLHRLGFYLLIAAVPAAAVAALWSIGDVVETMRTVWADAVVRLQALLSGLVLVLVLVAAAARSQTIDTSTVPPLSASALVACLALFALQGALALAAALSLVRLAEGSLELEFLESKKDAL